MSDPRIVDLSYPISSDMLVYPGMERPVLRWLKRVNADGANLTRFEMTAHSGTHVDAPTHFVDGGVSIDEVPLGLLFGTAYLFRYSKEPAGQVIGLTELLDAGFDLPEGAIFVLHTGIEDYAGTRAFNERFPNPGDDLLSWLVSKKIKAYMTDAPAIDPVNTRDSGNHHLILGEGIPIVENLCNLAQLPDDRGFVICALPIKLAGREGSPCRAVALPEVAHLGPLTMEQTVSVGNRKKNLRRAL
jgi:kynurenine formamidase